MAQASLSTGSQSHLLLHLALRARCTSCSLVQIRSRRICRPPAELRSTRLLCTLTHGQSQKKPPGGGFFYDWLGV